jgi:DNA-binding MarR family transcriptional regulator
VKPVQRLTERAPHRRESDATADRIATGLHKIGLVLRHAAWRQHGRSGLTPTQAQLLTALAAGDRGRTLSSLAAELGITGATASDSLSTLERKGLVEKRRSSDDGRALAVRPTLTGRNIARRLALWPDFLLGALEELDAAERDVFQRALVKMIRALQAQGQIPVARMCVGCRFFRPHVYEDAQTPHHCAFVDAPFGDRELRIDCADHMTLPPDEADAVWRQFVARGARSRPRKETR